MLKNVLNNIFLTMQVEFNTFEFDLILNERDSSMSFPKVFFKVTFMQNHFRATLKIIRDIWRIVLPHFTISSKMPNL